MPKERISHFSCGHIIPQTNLSTITLEQGPTGKELLFNFETRQDVKLVSGYIHCSEQLFLHVIYRWMNWVNL